MAKDDSLTWPLIELYLELILMSSEVDFQRVKKIFREGQFLCLEPLRDIFISNYKETDGKTQFKDLWLFSDNSVIEALNFSRQESFTLDISIFSNNIHTVSIETHNYNFSQKVKGDSRLHIVFYTLSGFSCDHISAGPNCDVLKSIYVKYIKPNLVGGKSSDLY